MRTTAPTTDEIKDLISTMSREVLERELLLRLLYLDAMNLRYEQTAGVPEYPTTFSGTLQ